MNAPLAQFLIEFTPAPLQLPPSFDEIEANGADDFEPFESEPAVTMTASAFEQAIGEARASADAEAQARVTEELGAVHESEIAALREEFEAARASWAQEQGQLLGDSLAGVMTQLETELSTALTNALRPLFSETLRTRILEELGVALEAILSDPAHPPVRIEGPADLLNAFGTAHAGDLAVDFVESDRPELTIITDTTRIETRLSACLSSLTSKG